jgi:glyoxylase-like metal-dependent hydrolase (beta-lactamase superfamily II)
MKPIYGAALLLPVVVFGSVAYADAVDANTVIDAVAAEAGAPSVHTFQFSATGSDYAFGQAPSAGAPWPKFIDKSYVRTVDIDRPATRLERVRLQGENPPRGGGGQPLVGEQKQTQSLVVDAKTPWAQQLDIWLLPQAFVKAAAAHHATVLQKAVHGKQYRVITFKGDNGADVNGYVDIDNHLVRVETQIDTAVLGDTPLEVTYADYRKDAIGAFPYHISEQEGAFPILDLTVQEVKFNVPLDLPPAAAADAAVPPAKSEKLGDDVYLITGGYAVIAVGFKDYVVLLEPGQSEARALAVIDETHRLFPGKPIKYVVNTHSHFDHSGGLRTFVVEKATILTYRTNQKYLQTVLSRPHTLNPDKAQSAAAKPLVEAVGEKKVLTDGTQSLELYHLQNFPHHDGTLIAYLPREKVLFEADGFNPPASGTAAPNPPSVYSISLLENVRRLQLDVQRIVPVHYPADNHIVTLKELEQWTAGSS